MKEITCEHTNTHKHNTGTMPMIDKVVTWNVSDADIRVLLPRTASNCGAETDGKPDVTLLVSEKGTLLLRCSTPANTAADTTTIALRAATSTPHTNSHRFNNNNHHYRTISLSLSKNIASKTMSVKCQISRTRCERQNSKVLTFDESSFHKSTL